MATSEDHSVRCKEYFGETRIGSKKRCPLVFSPCPHGQRYGKVGPATPSRHRVRHALTSMSPTATALAGPRPLLMVVRVTALIMLTFLHIRFSMALAQLRQGVLLVARQVEMILVWQFVSPTRLASLRATELLLGRADTTQKMSVYPLEELVVT